MARTVEARAGRELVVIWADEVRRSHGSLSRVEEEDRRVPADPVAVDVLHNGAWWPGWLVEWLKWPTGWRAFVRYTTAPGEQYLRWVNGDRVRRR